MMFIRKKESADRHERTACRADGAKTCTGISGQGSAFSNLQCLAFHVPVCEIRVAVPVHRHPG